MAKQSFWERIRIPHVFTLLTGAVLLCSILTYVIPSGQYQRTEKQFDGMKRTVVIPGTYRQLPKHFSLKGLLIGDAQEGHASPVGLLQFLSAIPRGLEDRADIIFFIFIIGGVFGILQRIGVITAALQELLRLFRGSGPALTIFIMIAIAIGGSTLGMGEELIPLVPLFLMVSRELGYDRIYGLALVMVAADVGFAAATTNPFTVAIAQGIAEIPLYGDIGFRTVFAAACLAVTLIYVLRYGARIKRDPSASIMAGDDFHESEEHAFVEQTFTRTHAITLLACLAIFGLVLYGVAKLGWWMAELSGGFLLMGFIAIFLARLPLEEAVKAFVKGMEEMVVAAMVVGFAKGIEVVLRDGQILDTLIYWAASALQHFHNIVAAEGMLIFQTCLNLLIPSGSGQAAVTMPLMAPLSDVLGLTRQTAVFAFTCGDGFSNSIIPTSGVLMAMLSLAKIPYQKWLKFMVPLFLQLMLLSAIFLAISVLWPGLLM